MNLLPQRRHPGLGVMFALSYVLLVSSGGLDAQTARKASASPNRFAVLAHRIITTSAAVKPGDAVVINGGKHTIPMMEALAIEVQKAGGFATLLLSSDSVTRSFYRDVPDRYLDQEPRYFESWVRATQVWISLPTEEDLSVLIAGIPEARMAKAAEAGQFIAKVANESGVRFVGVGFPSPGEARANGVSLPEYERLQWAAIGADYEAIGAAGERMRKALQGARSVHVTSPTGTDITFALGDRHVMVDDGQMSAEEAKGPYLMERVVALPGGRVTVAPIETSGTGIVAVADTRCRGAIVTGVRFEMHGGKATGLTAASGAKCLQDAVSAYKGPADRLGALTIGLNPAIQGIPRSTYYPSEAAGMVHLDLGGNTFLGGENDTPGGIGLAIPDATVTADDKVVVKAGRLVD